jgi:death on curing protein
VEAYPDFHVKAAVLLTHLVKNHPLPDGNKRCAYLACREFVERNGRGWTSDSVEETDRFVRAVASDRVALEETASWVAERIR